ncbi:MAG: peptidylprolyl isomerase [Verrucomicrobiales bacterium]|nr:peptidylprolyl isomerase [Verrucomicrobiales bacterium]
MKPPWSLTALALGMLALTACERPKTVDATTPEPMDEPIAVIDGRSIPIEKLQAELIHFTRGTSSPDSRRVLENFIEREQLVARALRMGLDRDPTVQRAIESVLIAKLKECELEPRFREPRVEVPDHTRTPTPDHHQTAPPDEVRLAVLRLEVNPKATNDQTRRAESRLEEARIQVGKLPQGTTDFGGLAAEYSEDPSTRLRGGDLGWLAADPSKYNLDPAILIAGMALLKPGDVSPVIRGRDAVYLVRLADRRPGRRATLESSASLAQHRDHIARRRSIEEAFLEETRRLIPVSVNTGLVARVMAQQATETLPPRPRL